MVKVIGGVPTGALKVWAGTSEHEARDSPFAEDEFAADVGARWGAKT
jgi:hypothetical protein